MYCRSVRDEQKVARVRPFLFKVSFLLNSPEVAEAAHRKDDDLHARLRDVYVKSTDPVEFDPDALKQVENPERPLPQRRTSEATGRADPPEHIFADTNLKAKRGKATLASMQDILALFRQDSRRFSPEALAKEHDLNPIDVENLVRHFRVFDMLRGKKYDANPTNDPLLPQPDWEDVTKIGPGAKKDTK